jgi:hypothetical protein
MKEKKERLPPLEPSSVHFSEMLCCAELQSIVPKFVAVKSRSRNFKRNVSNIISNKVVRTISSEMDTIRKRLGELEERIRKIDKLDKLEARVRSLEEKLQRKQ